MKKISYIYMISNGDSIKVGHSINPDKRLKQLQTGSPSKLVLLNSFPVKRKYVSAIEKLCHDKLRTIYVKQGEWFMNPIDWDIRCTIEEVCEKYILAEKIKQYAEVTSEICENSDNQIPF